MKLILALLISFFSTVSFAQYGNIPKEPILIVDQEEELMSEPLIECDDYPQMGEDIKSLPRFKSISLKSGFNVEYFVDKNPSVSIYGDVALLPLVQTEVSKGTLTLSMAAHDEFSRNIIIVVRGPSPQKVNVSDYGILSLYDLKSTQLDINVIGNSRVLASGNVKKVNASVAGNSHLDFSSMNVEESKVSVSYFGSATINSTKKVKLNLSKHGNALVYGQPRQHEIKIDESGSLNFW